MSENVESQSENLIPGKPQEEHTKEKEASFLARVLGWAVGRKQAGTAETDVKDLAERVKQLGPEVADEAVDAAISAYREEMVKREQAEKPPVEPEQ